MAEELDRQALLTAMTTEHFGLAGARAQTTGESSSRAALYYVLGLFTFIRVVENGVEDMMLGRAINRIRNYYLEIAGDERRYFMLSGHDDPMGVMQNMGVALERRQQFFTTGSMIAVINSVVGGATIAIAVGTFTDAPLGSAPGSAAWRRSPRCSGCCGSRTACTTRWVASPRPCSLPRCQTGASRPRSSLSTGWTTASAAGIWTSWRPSSGGA